MLHRAILALPGLVLQGCFSREDIDRRNKLFEEVDMYDPQYRKNDLGKVDPNFEALIKSLEPHIACASTSGDWKMDPNPHEPKFVVTGHPSVLFFSELHTSESDLFGRRHMHISESPWLQYDLFVVYCEAKVEKARCIAAVKEAGRRDPTLLTGGGSEELTHRELEDIALRTSFDKMYLVLDLPGRPIVHVLGIFRNVCPPDKPAIQFKSVAITVSCLA